MSVKTGQAQGGHDRRQDDAGFPTRRLEPIGHRERSGSLFGADEDRSQIVEGHSDTKRSSISVSGDPDGTIGRLAVGSLPRFAAAKKVPDDRYGDLREAATRHLVQSRSQAGGSMMTLHSVVGRISASNRAGRSLTETRSVMRGIGRAGHTAARTNPSASHRQQQKYA